MPKGVLCGNSAAVPAGSLDAELEARILEARRFKILAAITDIDLADPELLARAGLASASPDPNAFRDFSAAGIERRRNAGYKLAQIRLHELFETRGILARSH